MAKSRRRRRSRSRESAKSTSSDALAVAAYRAKPGKIILQKEAVMEGGTISDFLIILYGPPKIGKTRLAHYIPGIYFLPTEIGYRWIKARKTPIMNWATFRKFVKTMEGRPKFCKTVKVWCIDTADNLSKYCMQYVCGREGIAHPTDHDWGKGWEAYRDEFQTWILRLGMLGPGIICICHETDRDVVSRSFKITKSTPALPKTTYTILNNMGEIIIRMNYATSKGRSRKKSLVDVRRVLLMRPTENYDAGDRTGLLPEKIFFNTEKLAVKKLLSYFDTKE